MYLNKILQEETKSRFLVLPSVTSSKKFQEYLRLHLKMHFQIYCQLVLEAGDFFAPSGGMVV